MDIKTELSHFRATFDPKLETALSQLKDEVLSIDDTVLTTTLSEQLILVGKNGKRLRPFLVSKLYEIYATNTRNNIDTFLVATELFHLFCLIHDDVIDKADTRHTVDTLHRVGNSLYKDRQDSAHLGASQAILVGDILFAEVYRLFVEGLLERENKREILHCFNTMIREVCVGQMLDVDLMYQINASPENINTKNKLKTAYYSVVRPMHLGVLLAENDRDFSVLEKIGIEIGMVYQLQDDLIDVIGTNTGKERFTDVVQGQPTFLTNYIAEKDPTASKVITEYTGKNILEADAEVLQKIFIESGAVAQAEDEITKRYEAMSARISELTSKDAQTYISAFAEYLYSRQK